MYPIAWTFLSFPSLVQSICVWMEGIRPFLHSGQGSPHIISLCVGSNFGFEQTNGRKGKGKQPFPPCSFHSSSQPQNCSSLSKTHHKHTIGETAMQPHIHCNLPLRLHIYIHIQMMIFPSSKGWTGVLLFL